MVTPRLNISSSLFMGASFHLHNPENISVLSTLSSVAAIWPIIVYPPPIAYNKKIVDFSTFVSKNKKSTYEDTFAPHVMGMVDKVHALGFKGEGVFIAIVDTGVDYR